MMISSGETSTDETIALSALPYVLVDLSEFSDDDGGDSDGDSNDDDSDDGYAEEIFHYYDNCKGDIGDFECWMDEWDQRW